MNICGTILLEIFRKTSWTSASFHKPDWNILRQCFLGTHSININILCVNNFYIAIFNIRFCNSFTFHSVTVCVMIDVWWNSSNYINCMIMQLLTHITASILSVIIYLCTIRSSLCIIDLSSEVTHVSNVCSSVQSGPLNVQSCCGGIFWIAHFWIWSIRISLQSGINCDCCIS